MSYVTFDRLLRKSLAEDEILRRKVEADNRPLRSSADHMTDDELLSKLRSLGFDLDRRGVEELCEGTLSVEELADPLIDEWEALNPGGGFDVDWIWICLLALWERWWPDRVCMELLDDKIQAGYDYQQQDDMAACLRAWLDAWAAVLRLCDATGIRSIEEFDQAFSFTEFFQNWINDLEMELWNVGLKDRQFLTARIDFCSEALRLFPNEKQWQTENLRRALAETWFEIGEIARGEELFESWLTADPQWGWGWIGWSDCYRNSFRGTPKDQDRAEELLRRGYATPGVRDQEDIADRIVQLFDDTGRPSEADAWASKVRQPVNQAAPQSPIKVGRNSPCPCGSGRKYKKCCGSPLVHDRVGRHGHA